MQARLKNPAVVMSHVMQPLQNLAKAIAEGKVPAKTLELVHLRVSQINGCAVCLDMHHRQLKKAGEAEDRLMVLSAWRDAPFFTEAERAALALAEAETRIADRGDGVPDDVWTEAKRHYDDEALAQLVLHVAMVNVWNRLNVTTRQVAGAQSW